MKHPVSIKGVLLLQGRVVLVKNPRNEWELPGGRADAGEEHAQLDRLSEVNLPAGYRHSVEKWAQRTIGRS